MADHRQRAEGRDNGASRGTVFGATIRRKAYMQQGKLIRPLAEGHP